MNGKQRCQLLTTAWSETCSDEWVGFNDMSGPIIAMHTESEVRRISQNFYCCMLKWYWWKGIIKQQMFSIFRISVKNVYEGKCFS